MSEKDDRLIVLAGGDAVYVFRPDQDETAQAQQAVLDVAYPADETARFRVAPDRWPAAEAALLAESPDLTIVDVRGAGSE
ncbi:hypothetical protein [Micromonospora maritima]|uniref:hypothetical protein n=1 Tax=Micromonospora maritima TaxID=986711 RepID=UPI00157CB3AC|nr:hypothetical protein [Micromonospora maritima]